MHCIGYDLGGKGRLGKRFVWICAGRRKHGQIKQNFSRLLFHPLSNTQLNTDICNSARAQLKNKCEAAFDTSFHTRSHYPLTRAFCQFSHSRTRAERRSHVSIGSAIVRVCLMLRLFAHGLFSHFVKGINRWPRFPANVLCWVFLCAFS